MTDERTVEFLLDQLGDPAVTARAMFGGHGIYRSGRMFAIVYEGAVYMKVGEEEARTSARAPFRPQPNRTFPSFRELSADDLEDGDRLASIAARAHIAARRGKPAG